MRSPYKILDGLWVFPITLPGSLAWLNCYVIKGTNGGRNLLIDTGLKEPVCTQTLMEGIKTLGLDLKNTDVFLTHLHNDHVGNAALLEKMGARIIISSIDYRIMFSSNYLNPEALIRHYLTEGADNALMNRLSNTIRKAKPESFEAIEVSDSDVLSYGEFALECVHTPGHTPGHMCLYDSRRKILFTGDHILFDISPFIASWEERYPYSLKNFISSLKKIKQLDVKIALPAHRSAGEQDVSERVGKLLEHHRERLAEVLNVLSENGALSAYALASKMSWSVHGSGWDDYPDSQKLFAMDETLAHLEYLVGSGLVLKTKRADGVNIYCLKKPKSSLAEKNRLFCASK